MGEAIERPNSWPVNARPRMAPRRNAQRRDGGLRRVRTPTLNPAPIIEDKLLLARAPDFESWHAPAHTRRHERLLASSRRRIRRAGRTTHRGSARSRGDAAAAFGGARAAGGGKRPRVGRNAGCHAPGTRARPTEPSPLCPRHYIRHPHGRLPCSACAGLHPRRLHLIRLLLLLLLLILHTPALASSMPSHYCAIAEPRRVLTYPHAVVLPPRLPRSATASSSAE